VQSTLCVPESVIGQIGLGLKLATTISKAHIAVSGLSTELCAMHEVTIHSTSEEVGMALVVMGKWITQQHIPNL
jgi:cell division ATPase FtsA